MPAWLNTFVSAAQSAASVVGTVVKAAGSMLSTVVSGVVSAGSGVLSALSGVAGGLSSVGSAFIGAISGVLGAIGSVLGALVNAVQNLVKSLVEVAGSIVKFGLALAGIAIGAFVAAVSSAIPAMLQFAKAAGQLRATSGLSYEKSGEILNRFGSVGIGKDAVNGMFGGAGQSPFMFQMKAAAFGLPSYTDKNFLPEVAGMQRKVTDSNPYGPEIARSIMARLGMDNPQMRMLGNLTPARIRGEQAWTERVQSKLGVGGEATRKYAEDVPLLMNRIGQFIEFVKIRFANDLLPFVEGILGSLVDYLAANAGNIANAIRTGVEWLYADFPVLFLEGMKSVIAGAQWLVDGALTVVTAIINIGHGFANFVRSLGDADSGINGFIEGFLGFLEYIVIGFNGFMKGLATVGYVIWTLVAGFVNLIPMLVNAVASLGESILKKLGINLPYGMGTRMPTLPMPDWGDLAASYNTNPQYVESYKTARENMDFGGKADAIDAGLKSAQSGAEWLHDKATSGLGVVGDAIDGALKKLGTREERHLEFQRQIAKNTERAANATEKTAQNTDKSGMIGYGETASRIGSYIAEDSYLNLTRVN